MISRKGEVGARAKGLLLLVGRNSLQVHASEVERAT